MFMLALLGLVPKPKERNEGSDKRRQKTEVSSSLVVSGESGRGRVGQYLQLLHLQLSCNKRLM